MTNPRGAVLGAVGTLEENAQPEDSGKALSHNNLQSSRGGTRTRDPGIMSAVL